MIAELRRQADDLDALIIAEQVIERHQGVVTDAVRDELGRQAKAHSHLLILADSRSRLKLFHNAIVKPNRRELLEPNHSMLEGVLAPVTAAAEELARTTSRPRSTTLGSHGILVVDGVNPLHSPVVCITGTIHIGGEGGRTTARIVARLAAGGTADHAATVGCLVTSMTIQQLARRPRPKCWRCWSRERVAECSIHSPREPSRVRQPDGWGAGLCRVRNETDTRLGTWGTSPALVNLKVEAGDCGRDAPQGSGRSHPSICLQVGFPAITFSLAW